MYVYEASSKKIVMVYRPPITVLKLESPLYVKVILFENTSTDLILFFIHSPVFVNNVKPIYV